MLIQFFKSTGVDLVSNFFSLLRKIRNYFHVAQNRYNATIWVV